MISRLEISRCPLKVTFSVHKSNFVSQPVSVSHTKAAYGLCDLPNRHPRCSATSRLLQQGVNSGNRITQHVKDELGTTTHVLAQLLSITMAIASYDLRSFMIQGLL